MTVYRAFLALAWSLAGVACTVAAVLYMHDIQGIDIEGIGLLLVASFDFYMAQENMSRGLVEYNK